MREATQLAAISRPSRGVLGPPLTPRRLAAAALAAAVAMAPGGAPQKSAPPRPPDKGSFPLDHFKECSDAKAQYMQCLKAHGMRTEVEECRRLSAAYLQCRMDTQLMAPQPINRLGFEEAARQRVATGPDDGEKRARDGFIAGLPPKQANG